MLGRGFNSVRALRDPALRTPHGVPHSPTLTRMRSDRRAKPRGFGHLQKTRIAGSFRMSRLHDRTAHIIKTSLCEHTRTQAETMANAVRGSGGARGSVEAFVPTDAKLVLRNNRFEELPEWMGRIPASKTEPTARQRVMELQHFDEARRLNVESAVTTRKLAGTRQLDPGGRHTEAYMQEHPYERNMEPDRTPMRDESTLPRSSMVFDEHIIPVESQGDRSHHLSVGTLKRADGISVATPQALAANGMRNQAAYRPNGRPNPHVSGNNVAKMPKAVVRQQPSVVGRIGTALAAFADLLVPGYEGTSGIGQRKTLVHSRANHAAVSTSQMQSRDIVSHPSTMKDRHPRVSNAARSMETQKDSHRPLDMPHTKRRRVEQPSHAVPEPFHNDVLHVATRPGVSPKTMPWAPQAQHANVSEETFPHSAHVFGPQNAGWFRSTTRLDGSQQHRAAHNERASAMTVAEPVMQQLRGDPGIQTFTEHTGRGEHAGTAQQPAAIREAFAPTRNHHPTPLTGHAEGSVNGNAIPDAQALGRRNQTLMVPVSGTTMPAAAGPTVQQASMRASEYRRQTLSASVQSAKAPHGAATHEADVPFSASRHRTEGSQAAVGREGFSSRLQSDGHTGIPVSKRPGVSAILTEEGVQHTASTVMKEREPGIVGETPGRPRDAWQDRVAPFASFLGHTAANQRNPHLFPR